MEANYDLIYDDSTAHEAIASAEDFNKMIKELIGQV